MRVDDKKLDRCLHHPNETLRKINNLINTMLSCYRQVEEIRDDLVSYRPELLDSIDGEKGQDKKTEETS